MVDDLGSGSGNGNSGDDAEVEQYWTASGEARTDNAIEIDYADIADWQVKDLESLRAMLTPAGFHSHDHSQAGTGGIEVTTRKGQQQLFVFAHIRDVKHTLEFFWNKYQISHGGVVKPGSTHGRPIVSITTLASGAAGATPPDAPQGFTEVVDIDGSVVTPGGRMAKRRSSFVTTVLPTTGEKAVAVVPLENRLVKPHWGKIVKHQGWLLKKGGAGLGLSKSWIKRYFVLYSTSQGHFLVYYSDFTECPLYATERNHRNVVDLCKTTYLRVRADKLEGEAESTKFSFTIVTTEREWTVCAESKENLQLWLRILTRAVDEDVAILPDEELAFRVKTKSDPLDTLPQSDYSTVLRISAFGVSVCAPENFASASLATYKGSDDKEKEFYFWAFTDFYKWYTLNQQGKAAILMDVFQDTGYGRRNEFIFRSREASRIATAVEFFIEKFMTTMHVLTETTFQYSVAAIKNELAAASADAAATAATSAASATASATATAKLTNATTATPAPAASASAAALELPKPQNYRATTTAYGITNSGTHTTSSVGGRSGLLLAESDWPEEYDLTEDNNDSRGLTREGSTEVSLRELNLSHDHSLPSPPLSLAFSKKQLLGAAGSEIAPPTPMSPSTVNDHGLSRSSLISIVAAPDSSRQLLLESESAAAPPLSPKQSQQTLQSPLAPSATTPTLTAKELWRQTAKAGSDAAVGANNTYSL
jgi:hypothetical protein